MGLRGWLSAWWRKAVDAESAVPQAAIGTSVENHSPPHEARGVSQAQQVSLTKLKAGRDIITNITQLYDASSPEERVVAEALIRGPLQLVGVETDVERAKALRSEDRQSEAADLLVAAARKLNDGGYAPVGEFLLAEAAEALAAGGDRPRAAELMEEVLRGRLERFDSRAYFDARRLAEYLDEAQAWRADAYAGRAIWPEHPGRAVAALKDAWIQTQGTDEELRWGAALVEVLVTLKLCDDACEAAEAIRSGDPSISGDRDRLSVELDYLDALVERDGFSGTIDAAWSSLLEKLAQLSPALAPDEAAWVSQRRGAMLAMVDRSTEARAAYVQAIKEWNREPGNEEQIKECFFSFDQVALLSGTWTGKTQPIRIYASRLRGRRDSPVTDAERLERVGMQSRLADNFPDALRALWQAYGLSRVAGNLYQQRTAAELLAELLAAGGRRHDALRFLIEAGKEKEAASLVEDMGDDCVDQLRLHGPIWERTVSFAVIAEIGSQLSDAHVTQMTPVLLEAARQHPTSHMWPQPSSRARAALAALAAAVPEEYLDEVSDLLYEERQTWNADEALRALIVLTNLNRRDETERVAHALFDTNAAFAGPGPIVHWLGCRLAEYPSLHPLLREKAVDGNAWALEVLAMAELAPEDEKVIEQIDVHVKAFLGQRSYEEKVEDGQRVESVSFVNNTGIGVTALFCSPELRDHLVDRLLEIVANDNEAEMSRTSAADALYNLAGAMSREQALRSLPLLTRVGRGEHGHSQFEQPEGSARDPFARSWVSLGVHHALRASALAAASRIAARAELSRDELDGCRVPETLELALTSELASPIAAALNSYAWLLPLDLPVSFDEAIGHADPQVRKAAIRSFASRDALPPFDQLSSRAAADPDADVRAFYCVLAAEAGDAGRPIAEALKDDRDVFVRQRARQQLRPAAAA